MNVYSFFRQLFVKLGLAAPLTFDQQVWGAKSVMDLVQHGSQFLIAQGTAGQSCYTCWLGTRDQIPTAIVVEANGRANNPFPDDSHVKGCDPWTYPPKFTCSQAVTVIVRSGIVEPWATCTLKKLTDQTNPNYTFTFATHAPVTVDATTGKIM